MSAVSIGLSPAKWVDLYADVLYRWFLLRTNQKQVSEDLVQEVFLSAWKARESYNGSSSERNWLFAICKNKLIDHYRKRRSSRAAVSGSHFFDDAEHWTGVAAPSDWNMDQLPTDRNEFYKALNACLQTLHVSQHAAFTLRYMEGMESRDICKNLSLTMQHYWVLIHRAKLQLRECLQRNWLNL